MMLEEVVQGLRIHHITTDDGKPRPHVDEVFNTAFETLTQAQLLIDKFGSLEKALDAEVVVHCRECGIYNPEKGICNKPHESARYRLPDEYCYEGRYYKKNREEQ